MVNGNPLNVRTHSSLETAAWRPRRVLAGRAGPWRNGRGVPRVVQSRCTRNSMPGPVCLDQYTMPGPVHHAWTSTPCLAPSIEAWLHQSRPGSSNRGLDPPIEAWLHPSRPGSIHRGLAPSIKAWPHQSRLGLINQGLASDTSIWPQTRRSGLRHVVIDLRLTLLTSD